MGCAVVWLSGPPLLCLVVWLGVGGGVWVGPDDRTVDASVRVVRATLVGVGACVLFVSAN